MILLRALDRFLGPLHRLAMMFLNILKPFANGFAVLLKRCHALAPSLVKVCYLLFIPLA